MMFPITNMMKYSHDQSIKLGLGGAFVVRKFHLLLLGLGFLIKQFFSFFLSSNHGSPKAGKETFNVGDLPLLTLLTSFSAVASFEAAQSLLL